MITHVPIEQHGGHSAKYNFEHDFWDEIFVKLNVLYLITVNGVPLVVTSVPQY